MSDFKLSKHTRHIIDNFSKIHDAMVFRPGKTITVVSKDQDVAAFAEVEDIFPERFAIGSISKFLSILSLYEDPVLSLKGKEQLVIKGNGRRFNLTLASEKTIPTTEKDASTFLSQFGDAKAKFSLDAADLLAVKKNMITAGLPVVTFASVKDQILVTASDTNNSTSDVFEMMLKTKTEKQFNMMFVDRKIQNMIEHTYDVSVFGPMVSFSAGHGDLRVTYFNAPERGSKVAA